MKRLITCVLLLFATTTLSARENPLVKYLPYSHELGLRYGVQLSLGAGAAPEMQALSIDYACYGYSNIGFRTGLNLLVPTDIERGVSVPLQFSWRTGRIASAWRRARDEGESCRAYYNPWAGDPWAEPSVGRADPGQSVGSLLLSLLPSTFEIHAGFTPGLLFGPLGPGGHVPVAPADASWSVRRRFSCTADAGLRLIIPIWRFNLFGDFTYHCYLTDNFRAGPHAPSRSFMSLGCGLSFNF